MRSIICIIAAGLFSCDTAPATENRAMQAADDAHAKPSTSMSQSVVLGATLQLIENANLRDAPNAKSLVLRIVPSGSKVYITGSAESASGYYYVRHDGLLGWMNGGHLKFISAPTVVPGEEEPWTPDEAPPVEPEPITPEPPVTPPLTPPVADPHQAAIDRAITGVGFSYWWGGSKWDPSGVATADPGSCSGSCGGDPACIHSGRWGADCSGFVAKAWQVPASNTDLSVANHSYSTLNFANQTTEWSNVQRTNVQLADAYVYNTGTHGHIFLYESSDAWGKVWAYEAKGCSVGIVHNVRSADDTYKVIRRNGY